MASEIRILDDKVISQIAAGEVIERPGSVVKELVENALDADSTEITIKIENGGKKSITVIDNGTGMTKENAKKAFHRHSTSKILTLRDLESISSLGFRGEALASIAAVSKVTLRTKAKESEEEFGTEIFFEGGKFRHTKDTACNTGTTVTVSDLFYNTPARRKFLKTPRAELAKITDYITRIALNHPEIAFQLTHDGSDIINAPRSKNLLDNIIHIYGMEIAKEMLEIKYSDPEITVEGFISKPAVFRKSSSHITFFVNNRYIISKLLTSALREGYGNLIMKKGFPIAVISIAISPRKVDVNVHPAKLDIKFEDENGVYKAVESSVKETLSAGSLIPDIRDVTFKTQELDVFEIKEIQALDELKDIPSFVESKKQVDILSFVPILDDRTIQSRLSDGETANIPKMTLVGQILDTYIVAQSGENILIIDQHAAHERVVFEKLLAIQENQKKNHQELLEPLTMELTPKQKIFVKENEQLLDFLGFKMEHFGADTFSLRAIPSVFGESSDKKAIYDLIDELIETGKTKNEEDLREKAMAVVACHSAIRGGDELSYGQMKDLIKSLYSTKNVTSCPHGRPSILIMSKAELEKKFKRK